MTNTLETNGNDVVVTGYVTCTDDAAATPDRLLAKWGGWMGQVTPLCSQSLTANREENFRNKMG
jgi:hypothetical protein